MTDFLLFDVSNSIEHPIAEGETSLGRGADCKIRVLSSSVSRQHGLFHLEGRKLNYRDLGSSNGSYVNGQAITEAATLQNGDTLTVGDFQFKVVIAQPPAEDVGDEATQWVDQDATTLQPAPQKQQAPPKKDAEPAVEIPPAWAEKAGLEKATGTEFFAEEVLTDAVKDYQAGKLELPAIGDTARLVGLTANVSGQLFPLDNGKAKADGAGALTWKLGRDAEAVDIVLAEASVSGMHAQLVNDGPRWKVVNWMSTNGTFVNGQRTLSSYLKHGDVISMGNAELAFELPAAARQARPTASSPPGPARPRGILSRLRRWWKKQ